MNILRDKRGDVMGKYIRKIMVALLYVATFGISVAIYVSNNRSGDSGKGREP